MTESGPLRGAEAPERFGLYKRMGEAYRAGQFAAVAGVRRHNPYNGNAETAVERVLSVMWARGYSAGNPTPEPHLE